MQDVNGYLFLSLICPLVSLHALVSHPTLDTAVKGFFYTLEVICEDEVQITLLTWTVFIERQSSSALWFWLKVVPFESSESSECFMMVGVDGGGTL